jgi:hypothetical protein
LTAVARRCHGEIRPQLFTYDHVLQVFYVRRTTPWSFRTFIV